MPDAGHGCTRRADGQVGPLRPPCVPILLYHASLQALHLPLVPAVEPPGRCIARLIALLLSREPNCICALISQPRFAKELRSFASRVCSLEPCLRHWHRPDRWRSQPHASFDSQDRREEMSIENVQGGGISLTGNKYMYMWKYNTWQSRTGKKEATDGADGESTERKPKEDGREGIGELR